MDDIYKPGDVQRHAAVIRAIWSEHSKDGFWTMCAALHAAGYAILPIEMVHDGNGDWSGNMDDLLTRMIWDH